MSKRLFVGNLDFTTSEQDLRDAFASYGNLLGVTIVTDRMSGQSRGFGFVEIESNADADRATRELDGSTLSGRSIRVSEARERTGGGGGGGPRAPRNGGYDRW